LILKFVLEYATRNRSVQVTQDGLELNGTHQLLVYAEDVSIMAGSVHTVKENAETEAAISKETGLELNADKSNNMSVSGECRTNSLYEV
jgi:hypothetical protein